MACAEGKTNLEVARQLDVTNLTVGKWRRRFLTDGLEALEPERRGRLNQKGFRYIIFADDNFNPATLGRIAREPSPQKRKQLEQIREERLRFFEEYDRSVPSNLYAFTQMTTEVITDEEYLSAMYHKARIRAALIGIESFSAEGLRSANKQWNPTGQRMVETIQTIQDTGISVLSSIICGLESDTIQTIRTMRNLALESGSILAQFTFYHPYPGTKDFYEMMNDAKDRGKPDFVPKHATRISEDRFWLKPMNEADHIRHANISRADLLAENQACWDSFYSVKEVIRRTRRGEFESGPWSRSSRTCCSVWSLNESMAVRVWQPTGFGKDDWEFSQEL